MPLNFSDKTHAAEWSLIPKGHTMEAFENISTPDLLDSRLSLSAAFVAGALIGLERQYRHRTAGLRTNALLATPAA